MNEPRVYAQLEPDQPSRDALVHLQRSLPSQKQGRFIKADELHLTVIHFGKVDDMYEQIYGVTSVKRPVHQDLLHDYIAATETLLANFSTTLFVQSLSLFGPKDTALALELSPSQALLELHAQCYEELRQFLLACGLEQVDTYITNNPNLSHSPKLRPHITLYKGYQGTLPHLELPATVTLAAMPVRYYSSVV